MRSRAVLLYFVIVLLYNGLACKPRKNYEPELIQLTDSTQTSPTIDSGYRVEKDGLDYEPLNTGTYQQLPPELTRLLNQQYPGWLLPHLSPAYLKKTDRNASGPYYIQSDFDENNLTDFAVQFLFNDTTWVIAYLQQHQGTPTEYLLTKYSLQDAKDRTKIKLYIGLIKKGKEVYADSTKEKIRLEQNAVAVNRNSNNSLYIYDGRKFNAIKIRAD